MINFIKSLFAPTDKEYLNNPNAFVLIEKVLDLQKRIEVLESENVELTNALYECENRMEAKIDSIHPVVYNIQEHPNLNDYSLGEK